MAAYDSFIKEKKRARFLSPLKEPVDFGPLVQQACSEAEEQEHCIRTTAQKVVTRQEDKIMVEKDRQLADKVNTYFTWGDGELDTLEK